MKNNFSIQLLGLVLPYMCKNALTSKTIRKNVKTEYMKIMSRAKNIGNKNHLISCYILGAWFIALNRCDDLTPDENYRILEQGLLHSKMFRIVMGDAEHYLSRKKFIKQQRWAENTHKRIYKNDWVVNLIPGNEQFDLGYDYLECGICKLCKDEGCFELAKYLCKLDFMFADVMGLELLRTTTIADGGDKCDFRFRRK